MALGRRILRSVAMAVVALIIGIAVFMVYIERRGYHIPAIPDPLQRNPIVATALQRTLESLMRPSVSVRIVRQIDSPILRVIPNCEFVFVALGTNRSGPINDFISDFFRIRAGYPHDETWNIAIDRNTGEVWQFRLGHTTGLGEFLSAQKFTLVTDADVRKLWGLLYALRMNWRPEGEHEWVTPHSCELMLTESDSDRTILVVAVGNEGVVEDVRFEERSLEVDVGTAVSTDE